MNKNLKTSLWIGGGLVVAYYVITTMQKNSSSKSMVGDFSMPSFGVPIKIKNPEHPIVTTTFGSTAFSGVIDSTPIVGNRVW